jgi:hypothetical protein
MPCRHINEKTRPLVGVHIQKPLQLEKETSQNNYIICLNSSCSSFKPIVLIQIRFATSPPTTINWNMRYILNEIYESNSVKSTFRPGNVFAYNTMPSKDTF